MSTAPALSIHPGCVCWGYAAIYMIPEHRHGLGTAAEQLDLNIKYFPKLPARVLWEGWGAHGSRVLGVLFCKLGQAQNTFCAWLSPAASDLSNPRAPYSSAFWMVPGAEIQILLLWCSEVSGERFRFALQILLQPLPRHLQVPNQPHLGELFPWRCLAGCEVGTGVTALSPCPRCDGPSWQEWLRGGWAVLPKQRLPNHPSFPKNAEAESGGMWKNFFFCFKCSGKSCVRSCFFSLLKAGK